MPTTTTHTRTAPLTVRLSTQAITALETIAVKRGFKSRAEVTANMLELSKELNPDNYYTALAAFEKAARASS